MVASPVPSATGSNFWAESVPVWPLCTPSRLLVFHPPVDFSLCLYPPASILVLLQSAVPRGCFLSSGGFPSSSVLLSVSFLGSLSLPFRLLLLPSRDFPFVSLLLSFLFPLLPEVPCGSSFLLVALFLLPCQSWRWLSWGVFYYRVTSLSLWLFPVRFLHLSCWGSLPYVLRVLLFFVSIGYVPAFFWFPSFVTRSNLGSFATGSSLRAESPLSVVSFLLSHGFASCLLLFSVLSLLFSFLSFLLLVGWVPLCFVGSSLTFLYLSSLPVDVSRLRLFCFSSSFLLLSPLGGFPSSFLLWLPFSLVLFPYSCS